ncbi:MAG TPA: hypothetical protein VE618_03380 [Myxococcaceae bacterium]|nr:hypothetical protein [Myxococcaceae bacterium]
MSVLLPADLRARLERQARKRALKLSTTIKVLIDERLREIDMDEDLARAEEWQRAQVWATWERIQSGSVADSSWEEIEGMIDAAKERPSLTRSDRAKRSPKTSRRRSSG